MEYTRSNPFLASITERFTLNKEGSLKETMHLILNIKGSNISYKPGDSIAIQPENGPVSAEEFISFFGGEKKTTVVSKEGQSYPLFLFLLQKMNIKDITPLYLKLLETYLSFSFKQEELAFLLKEENKKALKDFAEEHTVVSFTKYFFSQAPFDFSLVLPCLKPLLPRFYSIASSPLAHPEEIYLTIGMLKYKENEREKVGVCSHFLSYLAPLNQPLVPLYLHPSKDFRLPEDPNTPIIMIGPGTGVAPFRAFLEERVSIQAKGENWLFFGDWHASTDFLYEEYFQSLSERNFLKIDAVFSRDQEEKVYVQHRMQEKGRELFSWLEKGAFLYVCGDATYMAKSVDAELHALIEKHGGLSTEESKEYVKRLRQEKRYLRDVY